jgi:segregation and condensation protein B
MFDENELKKLLEALVFISPTPLALEQMQQATRAEPVMSNKALEILTAEYAERGLQLIKIAGGYQICSRPEYASYINDLFSIPIESNLRKPAMETLSIIAYKQPVTRLEIEDIRGVISDSTIRTLLERNLIKEVGRKDAVGRPILYGTTDEFLRYFGLADIADLPVMEDNLAAVDLAMQSASNLEEMQVKEESL